MTETTSSLTDAEASAESSLLGSNEALNRLVSKSQHVQDLLEADMNGLSQLEAKVLKSIKRKELIARNVNSYIDDKSTFGQRVADKVATFGGSWAFIISFGVAMVIWIGINSVEFLWKPFDVYPFILLNLCLSTLAALQAPVILMSQNRQEAKDRLRGEYDYGVDLKAEIEIRHMNQKLDLFIEKMWQRHLEVQQAQVELLKEISDKVKREESSQN